MRNGVRDVSDMIDGDDEYEEIIWYKQMSGNLLSLLEDDDEETKIKNIKIELATAETSLVDIVESEDRAMKAVSKLMAKLEDEIENYSSERTTKKYKNIQSRLKHLTQEMQGLVAKSSASISLKERYKARLTQLRKEFER